MIANLKPTEIMIIVLLIVIVFGATKLPSIASNVGKSLKIFKKEVKDLREDDTPDTPTDSYAATGGVRVQPQPYHPASDPGVASANPNIAPNPASNAGAAENLDPTHPGPLNSGPMNPGGTNPNQPRA